MKNHAAAQRAMHAIRTLRIGHVVGEYDVHLALAQAFDRQGIGYTKEAPLAPRCRVDFLLEGGVGVEIKRAKPEKARLNAQLTRYCASGKLTALILVCERRVAVPGEILGVPIECISLGMLWGPAL